MTTGGDAGHSTAFATTTKPIAGVRRGAQSEANPSTSSPRDDDERDSPAPPRELASDRSVGAKARAGGASPSSSHDGSGDRHAPRRNVDGHDATTTEQHARGGFPQNLEAAFANVPDAPSEMPNGPPSDDARNESADDHRTDDAARTKAFEQKILKDTGIEIKGWRVETRMRQGGGSKGRGDVYYIPPQGPGAPKSFKSYPQAKAYVEAMMK